MSTKSRPTVRPSLAACLGLLLLAPAAASASGVVVHRLPSATAGHGARAYWTAKRMRSAGELPLQQVAPGPRGATPLRAPSSGPNAAAAGVDLSNTRAARPPKGYRFQPGDNPPYTSGEVPLDAQTVYPTSTNGRIFGKFPGIGHYSCSATVVSSHSQNVILTAGHCVLDADSGFASKIAFVPAYHDGARPFGVWAATREVVSKDWFKFSSSHEDYAAIKLKSPNGSLGDAVGQEGIAYNQPRAQDFQVIGYPFNLGKTELMWNCLTSFAGEDNHDTLPGKPDSGVGCDMTEGASGGGWTIRDASEVPYLNSVTSYGYRKLKNVLFGPYLTKKVLKVVNSANG